LASDSDRDSNGNRSWHCSRFDATKGRDKLWILFSQFTNRYGQAEHTAAPVSNSDEADTLTIKKRLMLALEEAWEFHNSATRIHSDTDARWAIA